MLIRRLRGMLIATVLGLLSGAALGLLLGVIVRVSSAPGEVTIQPAMAGGVLTFFALWGAIVGGIAGATFAALLMLAERGQGVENLRLSGAALWGGLASLAPLYLTNGSRPVLLGGFAIGAGLGASVVALAKRRRDARLVAIDTSPTQ